MTSRLHGNSSSPHQQQHAEPSTDEGDDNVLISKLCARAWDPGLRFDTAYVPLTWIEEHFGREYLQHIQDQVRSHSSDGTIQLKAHAEAVAIHFADAPRGPMFPPVTPQEVDAAETIIGRPLPELLRRIYTEVGNGGFGPDAGLTSVTAGQRAAGHLTDWPCSLRRHERNRAAGLPTSWLYLTSGGCTMEWHVSLLAADNPVLLYDTDGWVPSWGEDPHDGLRHATASLRQWLWTWANGGEVWAEALSVARRNTVLPSVSSDQARLPETISREGPPTGLWRNLSVRAAAGGMDSGRQCAARFRPVAAR
ncbi:SMI1/KNR4 family protein [Streptomyces sp. NPDC057746]|uniref:SMI1/KNR4 family protein n=1 Tax=Streptomyces sp. NPDC057746 TaxID=3346237 RepID=UPI00367C97C3